ncbi:MAG: DNA adenine methylase [Thermoplasmata archaeon]|nr:DNA adenine methylase [Thermoplasmata archaeon]
MAEPILKWAGGKRELLPEIISFMSRNFKEKRLHEPFFGGGAVTFWSEPTSGTINDINPRLMSFYEVVRDRVDELIEDAKEHVSQEDYYYECRKEFNKPIFAGEDLDDVREASLLLYLNKTTYNGLYRVNKQGAFNVPFGKYKNPTIVPEKQLREASRILKNLQIKVGDFQYVHEEAKRGDLVYFDPPYQPVSATANFTAYSTEGFDFAEQKRLRNLCLELHKNGVLFVLSNSWAQPVRELYEEIPDSDVKRVEAHRFISCDASGRGKVDEILVTNVPKNERVGKKRARVLATDLAQQFLG